MTVDWSSHVLFISSIFRPTLIFSVPIKSPGNPPHLAKVNLNCLTLEVQPKRRRVRWWSSQEVRLSGTQIRRVKLKSVKAYLSPGAWRWTCICRTTFLQHELQPSNNEVSICEDGSLKRTHISASAQAVTVTVPAAALPPLPTQSVVRSGRLISTGMRTWTRLIPTYNRTMRLKRKVLHLFSVTFWVGAFSLLWCQQIFKRKQEHIFMAHLPQLAA